MDNNILLLAGGVMLAISALLIYYYFRSKALLNEMWAVKTYDAAELKRMCADGFAAVVEVQGAVSCEKPILSFAGQIPCCWFHIKVRHEEERRSGLLESLGESATHVAQNTDWVMDIDRTYSAVFKVEDATGSTLVYPEGADIDSITAFDGTVTRDEPWLAKLLSGSSDLYHVTEEVFLPTGCAYVLGQASPDGNGNVMIRHPDHGYIDPDKSFFVISRKTEKELAGSNQISVNVCLWFGVVFLLIGAFFLAEGFGLTHIIQSAAQ